MHHTVRVLNRLLSLHSRSLPMYVDCARPYTHRGDERATETLQHIIDDHKFMVARIADAIEDLGGTVNTGGYPMEFTDLHDLSMDFILQQVMDRQRQDVDVIEACLTELGSNARGIALAQEALGAAKAHLQSLEELLSPSSTN